MTFIKFYIKIIKSITIVQIGGWLSSFTPGNFLSAGVALYEGRKNRQTAEAINSANIGYQERYNQQIFAREDNAVQRRALDLKAAGINPVLAAGQAAGAGGVATAPQKHHVPRHEKFMRALEAVALSQANEQSKAQISTLRAQKDNLNQQTENLKADLPVKKATESNIKTQTANTHAQTVALRLVNEFNQKYGLNNMSTPAVRGIVDAINQGEISVQKVKKVLAEEEKRISEYNKRPVKVYRNGQWHTLSYNEWKSTTNKHNKGGR